MARVVVVGLGPIGLEVAQKVDADCNLELVGLVDIDPAKAGKDLGELYAGAGKATPLRRRSQARVVPTLTEAVRGGADVAVLATTSLFDALAPMLRECLQQGLAVVTSCERMSWPWYRYPELADQIDAEAKAAGRALLGTGVNPGFVMDYLPVVLSSQVQRITAVRCERRVDAGTRRRPLQAKVGATMAVEQFRELASREKIGHEGLPESVAMVAEGLGRRVEPGSVRVRLEPVIADRPIPSLLGTIEPGRVAGIHHVGRWEGEGLTIELDLTMAVGTPDPRDVITLDGPTPLKLEVHGGTPGDTATVAALVNHISAVHRAAPGLRTMLDIGASGCRGQDA